MNSVGVMAPKLVTFSLGDMALGVFSTMKWAILGIIGFALASWAAIVTRFNKLLEVPVKWIEDFNKGLSDAYV